MTVFTSRAVLPVHPMGWLPHTVSTARSPEGGTLRKVVEQEAVEPLQRK